MNDRSWGLEAALDAILAAPQEAAQPPNLESIIASAGRRERHRSHLRRLNSIAFDHPTDGFARVEARMELRRVERSLKGRDWRLAQHVAVGIEYEVIADRIGGSAGALRVRMSRIRRELIPA